MLILCILAGMCAHGNLKVVFPPFTIFSGGVKCPLNKEGSPEEIQRVGAELFRN